MENADYEDKENQPPGLKFAVKSGLSSGRRKPKELNIAERARALREKVQEKYEEWKKVDRFVTETLTTPEELDSNRKHENSFRVFGR